ncbi:MAG: DJ-1/PfpI family protein [Thermoleophilaceae bacterium]|nr:DJ-1/PfpI family protein [Thermoleophilaceae bacterium]
MQIAILLFDGVTALDAVGPYEVLKLLPEADVRLVAKVPGEKATDGGPLKLVADHALADVPRPEILVVPGGPGARALFGDESVLSWLRSAHEHSRWTTSVCWGSALLGAAGLLEGLRATSHWLAREDLAGYGARPVDERVVVSGKVITSAGVSAGIDMALQLAALEAGVSVAQAIQLLIEYDPQPPFDAGSPETAPAEVVELIRGGWRGESG